MNILMKNNFFMYLKFKCIILYIAGFHQTITKFIPVIEAWKKVNHANIVQLKDVFITKTFNDNCE